MGGHLSIAVVHKLASQLTSACTVITIYLMRLCLMHKAANHPHASTTIIIEPRYSRTGNHTHADKYTCLVIISNSYNTGRRDVLDLLTTPSGATRPWAWSINPIHSDYSCIELICIHSDTNASSDTTDLYHGRRLRRHPHTIIQLCDNAVEALALCISRLSYLDQALMITTALHCSRLCY